MASLNIQFEHIPGKIMYLATYLGSKPHIPGKIVPRNVQKPTSQRLCVPGPWEKGETL